MAKSMTVRQLGAIITDVMIRDRIQLCYKMMNHHVHEMLAFKKFHGFCQAGISCTNKVMKGSTFTCAVHKDARLRGYKPRFDPGYMSPYAAWAKEQAEKAKKKLVKKKAKTSPLRRIK